MTKKLNLDEIKRLYLEEKLPLRKIGEIFNVSIDPISDRINLMNLKRENICKVLDLDQIKDLYLNKNKPCTEIGRIFNVSTGTIWGRLQEMKIKMRTREDYVINLDLEKIKELYVKQKKSLKETALIFEVSLNTLRKNLKKMNIKIRRCARALNLPVKEICKSYDIKNINPSILAKKYKCSYISIYNLLKRNGIKIKPMGSFASKGKNHPNFGKPRTEKTRQKIREKHTTPEALKKAREQNLGKKNPNFGKHQTEKVKKFLGKISKERWQNKEYKEKVFKKIFKSLNIQPNKPEKILIMLFKKHNLPFKYVGDGKVWIDGRNPDFISNDSKKIIEMHGRAYHDPTHRFGKSLKIPYGRTKQGTIKHYNKNGYPCLVIWDDELKDIDKVLSKIQQFNTFK